MSPSTAVVILNWNGIEQLRSFIPSIVSHTSNADIIVADNASTDNSVQWLKENYPGVKIIALDKNYGYAGGYNEALKHVSNDFLILLNSDVEVTQNWLEPLIDVLKTNPSVAACQPKILSYRNRNFFEYAGAAGGYIDTFGIPYCRGRVFTSIEEDLGQYDDTCEIFWASGACLAIRNEVFKKIGGFDSDFFAHMEEIDLCWTIHRLNYAIMYVPGSVVYHVGAATLTKENPRKTFLNFRNSLWMLYKHLPAKKLFMVLFIRMCFDGLAALHYLSKGQWRQFIAVFNAHMSFYFSGKNSIKRKNLSEYPYFYSQNELIFPDSIILNYYLKGQKVFKKFIRQI
jgi:GT2 family glycosyltransferase